MIGRREFVTLLGGAAATWPIAARAQQGGQMRRLGVLSNIGESDMEAQSMAAALHRGLRELGWVNGRNLQIDHRWGAGRPSIEPMPRRASRRYWLLYHWTRGSRGALCD